MKFFVEFIVLVLLSSLLYETSDYLAGLLSGGDAQQKAYLRIRLALGTVGIAAMIAALWVWRVHRRSRQHSTQDGKHRPD